MYTVTNDNVLITDNNQFYLSKSTDVLTINIGKRPTTSKVMCHTIGFENDYFFPLVFKEFDDDGNAIFQSVFLLEAKQLDYYKSIKKDFKFYITIDNAKITNEQILVINPKLILIDNSLLNEVYKNINELRQELKSQNSRFNGTDHIKKGMVPISTGVGTDYIWDYPNSNILKLLKESSELNLKLMKQCEDLTDRVNRLEKTLTDHIYEQYTL